MIFFDSKQHELREDVTDSPLYNPDIAPTPIRERQWTKWNFAALWVAMSVCIPTYLLASHMLKAGLGWFLSVAIILAGNIIVAIPMILNAHAGTKYGIPFPVFGRSVFGVYGVHIPSILRALVACGWFGIQCWVGGIAVVAIGLAVYDPALSLTEVTAAYPWLSFLGFFIFWLLNMYFVYAGTESIKWLENWSAPILLLMGALLLYWAVSAGGGIGAVLDQAGRFSEPAASVKEVNAEGATLHFNLLKDREGKVRADSFRFLLLKKEGSVSPAELKTRPFSPVQLPGTDGAFPGDGISYPVAGASYGDIVLLQFARGKLVSPNIVELKLSQKAEPPVPLALTILFWLAAMVGYWATLALNIPDISRYAKSQKDQAIGQLAGLPLTMMFYSFIGVVATAAGIIVFDDVLIAQDAPWDPATLISMIGGNRFALIFAQFALIIATLSTNIAANVISPANSFANAWPRRISFRLGGLISGVIGILLMPWKLTGLIASFLIAYGSALGPVVAVMIADYFILRRTELDTLELFNPRGRYRFQGGFNLAGLFCALLGALSVLLAGTLASESLFFKVLADGAWFSGFSIAFLSYVILTRIPGVRAKILMS